MIKVFQTIIDKNEGNCMQSAFASLFERKLEDVPHFLKEPDWFWSMHNFINDQGYEFGHYEYNRRDLGMSGDDHFKEIMKDETIGVNGFFYASVYSPKFFDQNDYCDGKQVTTHAVIIDREFNIVHDPNPNNSDIKEYPLAKMLGYNGIKHFIVMKKKL